MLLYNKSAQKKETIVGKGHMKNFDLYHNIKTTVHSLKMIILLRIYTSIPLEHNRVFQFEHLIQTVAGNLKK
jgi:hypothetical protein